MTAATASSATTSTANASVFTSDQLRDHYQGHRRVTRRMIEAFPNDKLFTFAVGNMRPFSALVLEFIRMGLPIVRGVATGKWTADEIGDPQSKSDLLRIWDEHTEEIDRIWPSIPPHRWQEMDSAFGQWPGLGINLVMYAIDNEIHHRGQAYVYLRALGVEPPPFYDRS
jgi:uncharacterized damage-inducible protein DinB